MVQTSAAHQCNTLLMLHDTPDTLLQYAAAIRCNTHLWQWGVSPMSTLCVRHSLLQHNTAPHILQHTLQHTLQRTLQYTLQQTHSCNAIPQHASTTLLQHTPATHCNTQLRRRGALATSVRAQDSLSCNTPLQHAPATHYQTQLRQGVAERWGAGVENHFQEFNEPYAPS